MGRRNIQLLGVAGIGLMVLPWLPWPSSPPAPGPLPMTSPHYTALVECADHVETAARNGRIQLLRQSVTPGYLRRLEESLAVFDRSLSPASLKEQGFIHGQMGEMGALQSAEIRDDLAIVVRGIPYSDIGQIHGVLRAWQFRWDGWRWRLDRVADRRPEPGDLLPQARRFSGELLAAPGRSSG